MFVAVASFLDYGLVTGLVKRLYGAKKATQATDTQGHET